MNAIDLFDANKTPAQKRQMAREWLRAWQHEKLPGLRGEILDSSHYNEDVTLVAYTFPKNESDFDSIEFSVRQSWHCLGRLKTVVIADRMTPTIHRFAEASHGDVDVQVEPALVPGSIASMSHDCITKLFSRFTTPYCLVVQDDGFPLQGNLGDFLGKYDYIGSPVVRDVPAQYLVDLFRIECLNGGFSLRSRKICQEAATQWNRYWRHFITIGSKYHVEDVFYTKTACFNLLYRFRHRFPSCRVARRFCLPDFDGELDIRNNIPKPFGVHGPTAIWQLMGCPAAAL